MKVVGPSIPVPEPEFMTFRAGTYTLGGDRYFRARAPQPVRLSSGDVVSAANELVTLGARASALALEDAPTDACAEDIKRWLKRFGPLGIDLLDVVEIRMATTKKEHRQALRRALHGDRSMLVHVWADGRWTTREATAFDTPLTMRLVGGDVTALEETQCFSGDVTALGGPQTRGFWRAYGEQIDRFASVAARLFIAAKLMSATADDARRRGLASARQLARTATTVTVLERHSTGMVPKERLVGPTLLAVLARHIIYAFAFRQMFICPWCRLPATRGRRHKRVCSDGCRGSMGQDIDRGTVRGARALIECGKTDAEAIRLLGGTEEARRTLRTAKRELRRLYTASTPFLGEGG